VMDTFARAKLIVRTTLLHARETAEVVRGAAPVELALRLAGDAPVLGRDALDDHIDVVTRGA
jgi:hypothetical protein